MIDNNDVVGGKVKKTSKEIVKALMNDFLDDTRERLGFMEEVLNSLHDNTSSVADALTIIKREAHNIKGISYTFDFAIVSKIMHQLEDYLDIAPFNTTVQWQDAQMYIDTAEKIINSSIPYDDFMAKEILSSLPNYTKNKILKNSADAANILLVSHSRTISLKVQTELLNLGFNIIIEKDPFVALTSIVKLKPNLVIASEELEGLSGINLLRVIQSITSSDEINVMLLSSFDNCILKSRGLPENIPVVSLGNSLNTELRAALSLLSFPKIIPDYLI